MTRKRSADSEGVRAGKRAGGIREGAAVAFRERTAAAFLLGPVGGEEFAAVGEEVGGGGCGILRRPAGGGRWRFRGRYRSVTIEYHVGARLRGALRTRRIGA